MERRTYTHFWATRYELTDAIWYRIAREAKKIFRVCDDLASYVIHYPPSNLDIRIDSLAPREHSLFVLTPKPASFAYARTNRESYDIVVSSILLIAKCRAPEWITLTSDGTWSEWENARDVCREVLHYADKDFASAKADFDSLLDPNLSGEAP